MNVSPTPDYRSDWQTPDSILERIRRLGPIALDPCTSEDNPTGAMLWLTEQRIPTTLKRDEQGRCFALELWPAVDADGLTASWSQMVANDGVIYVNPPYGRVIRDWIDKCIAESVTLGNAELLLLVPANVETQWYDAACESANARSELRGRLRFKGARDVAKFPSAIFYWGLRPWLFCHVFAPIGRVCVMRER